jgi:hypothetical protein
LAENNEKTIHAEFYIEAYKNDNQDILKLLATYIPLELTELYRAAFNKLDISFCTKMAETNPIPREFFVETDDIITMICNADDHSIQLMGLAWKYTSDEAKSEIIQNLFIEECALSEEQNHNTYFLHYTSNKSSQFKCTMLEVLLSTEGMNADLEKRIYLMLESEKNKDKANVLQAPTPGFFSHPDNKRPRDDQGVANESDCKRRHLNDFN